ncbi:MAG: DUF5335 family protein [Anaerolineaceae bacterium]|nr:MAG: DUF5335 family protein [Anaerolineaceae bacterium]
MRDHIPKYQSENLPKYHWPSFFADLLEAQKNQPVSVLQGEDLILQEAPTDTAPLLDIEYKSKRKGKLTIKSGGETTSISAPNLVWVTHDAGGGVVEVEIIDEKNHKVILRFD